MELYLLFCLSLLASSSYALDRNVIRQRILARRVSKEVGMQLDSSLSLNFLNRRTRRASTDLDVVAGSGSEATLDDLAPPVNPSNEVDQSTSGTDWIWYRNDINFLDSIALTPNLKDHHTDEFYDLAGEIMVLLEDYLASQFDGYLEATPLMFTQSGNDAILMVDVGTCESISSDEITNAMVSLVRGGTLGRFRLSPYPFKIKYIGTDPGREECQVTVAPTEPFTTTFTVADEFDVTTATATTTTTEPTPPDAYSSEDDGPVSCGPGQATCKNLQCIDRLYVCDGAIDCYDGSDEDSCSTGTSSECDPTQFLCIGTAICAQKHWRCDGDDDCGNGFDEQNCPNEPNGACPSTHFQCGDGSCVPGSYQCDGEQDCEDNSDERGCSAPVIIVPPPNRMEAKQGETVTMRCEGVGTPTPIISWRVNWGNVPPEPRVTMTSRDGVGTLTIRKVKPSDQGAYTCEGLNRGGAILAVPDLVLVVTDSELEPTATSIPPPLSSPTPADETEECPPGEFNSSSDATGGCKRCFCFGVTDQCHSSNFEFKEIGITFDEPEDVSVVDLEPAEIEGGVPGSPEPINSNQITVNPAAKELQLIDLSKRFLAAAHYWSLPAQFLGAKINSYGGTLKFSFSYNNSYNFPSLPTNNSDVILVGNGQTLVYRDDRPHPSPVNKHTTEAVFDEEKWKKPDGTPVTREDMLTVLSNISSVLLRTAYDNSMLSTGIGDVSLQVAEPKEKTSSPVSAGVIASSVEECICPEGYTGLSCEECDIGYERHMTGPYIGECITTSAPIKVCKKGYTGKNCTECAKGYSPYLGGCTRYPDTYCDVAGSIGVGFGQTCQCKEGCQGPRCNECKPGHYFLSEANAGGCLSCFCMGITDQCTSSNLNRSHVIPNYDRSENFVLTNAAGVETYQNDVVFVTATENRRHPYVVAHLDQLHSDVFYWMLPDEFLGNKLTSYGGQFDYIVQYEQGNSARPITRIADLRLTGNGQTLIHVSGRHPPPGTDTRYVVAIQENNWQKPDGSQASREDLLMVLSNIESFLVRASYSNQMLESRITGMYLVTAVDRETGRERALEVEKCRCPVGYRGLSCEECSSGFYRVQNGNSYLGTCQKCNCHGHSAECDLDSGICQACSHNTVGDNCEVCASGYYGDARAGGVEDCQPCPCPTLGGRTDQVSRPTCRMGRGGQPVCDRCPIGYAGDRCERCAPGYEGDPLSPGGTCRQSASNCDCDPSGAVDNTCDSEGQCNCKESTQGSNCGECRPGFFHLSFEYNGGCLPCFCMGLTRQCTSASYQRNKVVADFSEDNGGFMLTNRQLNTQTTVGFEVVDGFNSLSYPRMETLPRGITYYWRLSEEYQGDKIVSYGGQLNYSVGFTAYRRGSPINEPDVILRGNDIELYSYIPGDVVQNALTERGTVFHAKYWTRADGQAATREHLLMALADVEEILIQATYSTTTLRTTISQVTMETASESAIMSEPALEVEHCVCPDGYEGLSCEDCAPGYTRSGGGIYLGLCTACQCNGHAELCDTETGECLNCRNNRAGAHCENCAPGYFGNPNVENGCRPCACPGIGKNSFSDTCDYDTTSNTLTCTACQEGYTGDRCESCATGYVGNPTDPVDGSCVRIDENHVSDSPDLPRVSVSPKHVNANPGQTVTLRCAVVSRSRVRITWERSGQGLPSNTLVTNNGQTLTLPNVGRSSVGTFECVVANRYGSASDSAVVTLARPQPMIAVHVEEPRQVTVQVGSEVSFVCTAASKVPEAFIVTWTKRGGRLPLNRATDFDGILHITNVDLSDSGTYMCTGSSMYGIAQESATLRVIQVDDAATPVVVVTPNNQSVMKGDDVIFYCNAEGYPDPEVEWQRVDGNPMSNNVHVSGQMLMIPSASMHDRALYRCRASNQHGTAEATGALEVFDGVPPVVTVVTPEVSVIIGESVALRCTATGEPSPTFSWVKRGRLLPPNSFEEGGILRIESAVTNNVGVYQCTAHNTFGQDSGFVRVDVLPQVPAEKPICRTEPQEVTAYVGTNSTTTCYIGGTPMPTMTWEREDGLPLDENIVVKDNKLQVIEVQDSNAGRYVCVATSAGGVTKSRMTLNVVKKDLPHVTVVPARTQRVQVGDNVEFNCQTNESDADVTWLRSNQRPFTGQTSLSGDNRIIRFQNVSLRESGYYSCIASNVVGHREVLVYMEVLQKPVIKVLPARIITLRDGESVALRCMAEGNSRPSVTWKKLSATEGGHTRTMTRYRQASSTLQINRATMHDAGQYMCMAINNAGRSHMEVRVMVHPTSGYEAPIVTVGTSLKHVTVGTEVQLRCVASGTPAPTIVWSKENQDLPAGSRQSEGILYIPQFMTEDAGKYVCKAANELGMDDKSVDVELQFPPSLAVKPSAVVSLAPGQSTNITCSAISGTLPVAFSWKKDDGVASSVLTAGGLMQVTGFDPLTDAGVYTCTGTNDAGSSTTSLTILEANPPIIQVQPTEVTKTVGDFIEFQCTPDGDALDVEISWSRVDGQSLPEDRALTNLNGRLAIEDIQVADAGVYQCTASNAAGTTSDTVTLQVQAAPTAFIDLIGNEDILIEGRTYEIFCNSSGIPKPDMFLYKGDTQLPLDDESRHAMNGTASDSGTYACVANNSVGTTRDTLDVLIHGSPEVKVEPTFLEVRAHEPLTLSCLVNSTLASNITWSKQDGELSPNMNEVLDLGNALPENSGVYVCSAANQVGSVQQQATVVVHSFIPFFSQTERSYVAMDLTPNQFYISFNIKLSFRANSLNGLLLYAFSMGSDFISLNMADGYLDFRFDVGSGSVTIRSASAAVIGEWHTVVISRNGKTGEIRLDDGEVVKGKSPGEFRALDVDSQLYLGGIPRDLDGRLPREIQNLGHDLGFYGCISQLEVNTEVIDMGSPEVNRVGIVRCKTCGADKSDSPCYNEGMCVETYDSKTGFACQCPDGILGDNCQFVEQDLCKEGSCAEHGTCERDLGRELGYRCICETDWVGPRCANQVDNRAPSLSDLFDVVPNRPRLEAKGLLLTMENVTSNFLPKIKPTEDIPETVAFNKESYMMSKSVRASLPQRTDITMRIRRNSRSNGLLLFNRDESNGNDQFSNYHFVSLAIRDNAIEFRFSWGTDTAIIRTPASVIGVGTWHVIRAIRRRGKGKVEVDGRVVARAKASGFGLLGVTGPMFIGGVKFWEGIADKVYVRDGFDGCVSQLKINKKNLAFGKKFAKKNIGVCTEEVVAENNDILSDMQPSGMFLARSRPSARFVRSSYASFHPSTFLHDGAAEQISFRFHATNPEGLIFFHGEVIHDLEGRRASSTSNGRRRNGDFISVGLQASYLVYSFDLGGGRSSATSTFPVVDGLWHKATIVRRGSLALMWIDDHVAPTAVQSASTHNDANTPGRVYVGGAPDVRYATAGLYTSGFAGCLQDFKLTSVSTGRATELGSRYLDDADTPSLDFSSSGALERVKLRACRSEPVGLFNLVNL
uniref:Basement membrane-specific heparan sulfate proteoglycan core protein-like n=1 Tax=Phallusia mammillata TaxID=59560 RepID=A0A6F9DE61_9ASCI|nr:basement membrane-specific heparan sulfate proteoglycan core protein-like [Phallusia mammillata]